MNQKDAELVAQILDDYYDARVSGNKPNIEDYVQKYNLSEELRDAVLDHLKDEEWIMDEVETVELPPIPHEIIESAGRKLSARIRELQKEIIDSKPGEKIIEIPKPRVPTLKAVAEDSSQGEELKSRIMHGFTNKEIHIREYTGELLYRNLNTALLVFREGNTITTKLDGCIVDFSVGEHRASWQVKDGAVVIDFNELGISIADYSSISFTIRRDNEIIHQGSLRDE